MKNRLKIAMYLRLSKEDDWNAQESNSISYQRLLLRGYIERNFENYEILEFVDDGYSGTSMDRPAMQELLAAARQKKVDCIIVKDFSRFARDYVETGFYVEQIFPFLGIRFISVNDHYDSEAVTKKTIGMNLASAIINWVLTGLSNVFEITGALTVLGIVLFVLAGLVALFVKGTPEEDGCYPDNDPAVAEMLKNEEMPAEIGSQFSYKDAIKNKYVWMYGIGNGFFGLATVGIMSQLLSFFQEVRGYDASSALTMLTIAAVIGIAGAWIWGAVDQKLGPQKTCLIFGIWYLAGIILLISPLKIGMYVGLIMLGASIGGNGQFGPVLAAQAFGRKDFSVSFSCMNND